jgi:hypothetical protein
MQSQQSFKRPYFKVCPVSSHLPFVLLELHLDMSTQRPVLHLEKSGH